MKVISNRRGQMAIEFVMVLVILMIAGRLVANFFTQNEVLAGYVAKPWAVLAGIIENGVPLPPDKGRALHPNHIGRHSTMRGRRDGG